MTTQNNKGLNIALWVAQVLLGAMFIMVGTMKTFTPIEKMAANMAWVKDYAWLIRFIGISELAGGLGLLLPSILRIKPVLTPLAACGIVTVMVFATIFHAFHGEYAPMMFTLVIALIAAYIAWGRFKKAPIAPR